MSATRDRSRQKRVEKKTRNKRERARAESRRRATAPARTLASLVSRAAALPFGPAWVSAVVDDDSAPPALVTVVVTRQLSRGVLLAQIVLVDRTCLGVKNAFVMPPQSELELERQVAVMSAKSEQMRRCEPLFAQSVVFHALDYARSLGFEPQRDFQVALFGPRPAELLATAWSGPERPWYLSGPDDDVPRVMRQLDAIVGHGGYELLVAEHQLAKPRGPIDEAAERAGRIDWREPSAPAEDVLAGMDQTRS